MVSLPRLLIAAPASGGGKTTAATGLMAALRAAGRQVAGFKVGPDYIDSTYHGLATGRPGRNLDPFLCGPERVVPLLLHGASQPEPADIAVIEGVMGLFDGRLGTRGEGSSAHVAALTKTPVVLVIDCSHASRTYAAVAAGLASFEPNVQVAGVILNRVGSARHGEEIASAMADVGLPVLGQIPRDATVSLPSRHLGLIPANEWSSATEKVSALAALLAASVDLDAISAIAAGAPELEAAAWDPALAVTPVSGDPVIAVAGGRAFTFSYAENAELLAAAGAKVEILDPLTDQSLPAGTSGIFVGGGFPEMHAPQLAANAPLLGQIRQAAQAGMPVVGECAGLLLLSEALDGHPMTGVLPGSSAMGARLKMGYRVATAPTDNLLLAAGETVHGHEFHRTEYQPTGQPAWEFTGPPVRAEGVATENVHASYLHLHWAGCPQLPQRFVQAAADWQAAHRNWQALPAPAKPATIEPDLRHHGDRDLADGLLDFAVNVAVPRPPDWLIDEVLSEAMSWAKYPDQATTKHLLADHLGVNPAQLLLTAGAAESFTLIARALPAEQPLIVHPQFTEPEAAFLAAGRDVERHILGPANDFALNAAAIGRAADLVMIGNPTNPTGRLHPRNELEKLRQPGRILVVDEAFMDMADADESMLRADLAGLLVIRSVTKTYGVAGLRAGFVVGDAELIAKLAEQQSPWAVSTPALAALRATTTKAADEHTKQLRQRLPDRRAHLVAGLQSLGLRVVESQAPFVLVDTASLGERSVLPRLAELGIAVRRGETFPGLGPTWIRLAVRDEPSHEKLFDALSQLKASEG